MNEDIQQLKSENQKLRIELDIKRSLIQELKESVKNNSKFEKDKQKIRDLILSVTKREEEVSKREKEVEKSNKYLKTELQRYSKEIIRRGKVATKLNNTNKEKQKSIDLLIEQIKVYQQNEKKQNEEMKTANKKNTGYLQRIKDLEDEIVELKSKNNECCKRESELSNDIFRYKGQIDVLDEEKKEIQKILTDRQNELLSNEKKIDNLEQELEKKEISLSNMIEKNKSLEDIIEETNGRMNEQNEINKKIVKNKNEEVFKMKEEIERMTITVRNFDGFSKEETEKKDSKIQELNVKIESLENEIMSQNKNKFSLKETIERFKNQIELHKKANIDLEEKQRIVTEKNRILEENCENLTLDVSDLYKRMEVLEEQRDELISEKVFKYLKK